MLHYNVTICGYVTIYVAVAYGSVMGSVMGYGCVFVVYNYCVLYITRCSLVCQDATDESFSANVAKKNLQVWLLKISTAIPWYY